jgi:type VI secretion system secreted protein Hcp
MSRSGPNYPKQEKTMATDSYLQVAGVKGESTDSEHKDWIEILSYEHTITQPASATANSTGGTTGRCKHEPFVISKYVDLASPLLYQLCCSGKHVDKVVLELMRSSGDSRVKYLAVEMDQVVIAKVAPSSSKADDLPTESISFDYGVIKWTYTQQKRDKGAKGGNVAGGWSLLENKTAA